MRLKPGQTAPQMPPRGPKGPIKKPLAAQPIKNAAPAGRTKGGIGMIGGPKPSIPTPVNPSPKRPPLKAAPVTGVTRGRVEQNYRGIPGLVNASMDTPNFKGGASNRIGNAGNAGFKRAKADFGMPTPPSTNVNPVRPQYVLPAGAPQGQRTQSGSMASMGAGAGMLKPFGAKKGGKVPSKMGAVKTSASRDGVAKKGKTKGRMV